MLKLTDRTVVLNLIVIALALLVCSDSWAIDPEGCQVCHRYRGLGRLDDTGKKLNLYYVDPAYYDHSLGPHARLLCTDCHDRSEVQVVPHKKTRPVDCTQSCHMETPGNLEVHFAHNRIEQMLNNSVHTLDILNESNQLLGPPLSDNQSRCLLCHDEPTFRLHGKNWAKNEAPVGRCNVCHDESLPVDTRFYYWHVHARSMPANSNQEITRMCAACHSNQKIKQKYDLPDSTATYLASFHGKGMLLGDKSVAGCVDCHVGQMENVHQILSPTKPESSTNSQNISDTCRSPNCHPRAGEKVGSAAIHLDLSTSRGIEYFIATIFVIMIIMTFGPSAMLMIMDMLQIVLGRQDPSDQKNHHLAVELMKDPRARKLLRRFTPFQRVQHWALVITFSILVITGYSLKFADRPIAVWFVELLGSLSAVRILHRVSGALLLIGFSFHMVIYIGSYILAQKKSTGKSYLWIILTLPMLFSPRDFMQMGHQIIYLLCLTKTRPKWGRFSLEEKFEYFGVLWGTILLGVTGLIMWDDSFTSRYLPGRVLTVSYLIHSFESYLALLHVGIVHLAGVLLSPAAFPCSPAMFSGNTPIEELAESHPAMLEDVKKQLQEENPQKYSYLDKLHGENDSHAKPSLWHTVRVRLHALLVLLIVAWATYMAVMYLFRSVFKPLEIPQQYHARQGQLSADSLKQDMTDNIGDAARAPMNHYHGVDRWFEPDPFNGCTSTGCHSAMPHNKIAAVRSFDNFHTTFISCHLCHEYAADSKSPVMWYSTATGKNTDTPSILKLIYYFETSKDEIRSNPEKAHGLIVGMLDEAIQVSGGDELLEYLLLQIETSQPDSPVWRHAIAQLNEETNRRARGEYGAKLIPVMKLKAGMDMKNYYKDRGQQLANLAKQYHNAESGSKRENEIYLQIHSSVQSKPHKCLTCHSKDANLVDYETLGYSPKRINSLKNSPLAGQIQQIQEGKEFHVYTHKGVDQ
ncbi:MAG: cytochrome b/b6 domain-containing protein [Phycisphaerae bacterium]|nr:cytochrome b/b6 domain-containing protein [Phycisphaerae bacterium]